MTVKTCSMVATLRRAAMAGAFTVAGVLPAAADPAEAPDFVNDRAFDVAMARIVQDLSHEQVAVLNLIAHATAAAGLCDNLTLDEGAVHGALVEATHDSTAGASAEDVQNHRDFAMIAYGVLVGLAMDRAVKDEAAFCADATAKIDDPEENMFLTLAEAPAEDEAQQ